MIFVSSFEKAKSFYVDLFGLEIAHDMSETDDLLIMKNEGCYLTIHRGFQTANIDKSSCRVVPIFKVPDVEAMVEKLQKSGIALQGQIVETPVHRYQTLKDFDGNWIEVAQFKSRF